MTNKDNICVIIPSLDPDERLAAVVDGLRREGFSDIILVDDGSRDANKKYFPTGEDITLLVHEVNRGKGEALKTAMRHAVETRTELVGVVTCDGDGQHLAADVTRVAEKMRESGDFVLGVRDFSLPDVPTKSRVGNRLSSAALALCCGKYISDTQTGLRAIPASLLEGMLRVEGSRFEYETNVLLKLREMKARVSEVCIETVYLDENKGTHFHPVKDTIRIFSLILKYIFSSALAFLTDIILFGLCNSLFSLGVITSTVIARVISSVVNFIVNKKVVFKSGAPLLPAAIKYYALAIPVMLISGFGVKWLAQLLSLSEGSPVITLVKIVVDCILFIANYKIQKKWIFK